MVEQETRPDLCKTNTVKPESKINTVQPSRVPLLTDLAATILSAKPKNRARPKATKAIHPKPGRVTVTETEIETESPKYMVDKFNISTVKRAGLTPTDEEGFFEISLKRKNRRLLRQRIELHENAHKIKLLCMMHDNINLNSQIAGTPPVIDVNESDDPDESDETEEDEFHDSEELKIHTPETILEQFEKAEAALAINESGIVTGNIHSFNKSKWTEPLNNFTIYKKFKKTKYTSLKIDIIPDMKSGKFPLYKIIEKGIVNLGNYKEQYHSWPHKRYLLSDSPDSPDEDFFGDGLWSSSLPQSQDDRERARRALANDNKIRANIRNPNRSKTSEEKVNAYRKGNQPQDPRGERERETILLNTTTSIVSDPMIQQHEKVGRPSCSCVPRGERRYYSHRQRPYNSTKTKKAVTRTRENRTSRPPIVVREKHRQRTTSVLFCCTRYVPGTDYILWKREA